MEPRIELKGLNFESIKEMDGIKSFKTSQEIDEFIIHLPYYLAELLDMHHIEGIGIDDAWIDKSANAIIFDSWKLIPDCVKRDFFCYTGFKIISRYHKGVFDGDGGYRHKIKLNVKPLDVSVEEVRDNIYDLIKNFDEYFIMYDAADDKDKNVWLYEISCIYDDSAYIVDIEEEINKIDHVFASSSMNMDDGDWTIECIIDGRPYKQKNE